MPNLALMGKAGKYESPKLEILVSIAVLEVFRPAWVMSYTVQAESWHGSVHPARQFRGVVWLSCCRFCRRVAVWRGV